MDVICIVCKQHIDISKGDSIQLCMVDDHMTRKEVEKLLKKESAESIGAIKENDVAMARW